MSIVYLLARSRHKSCKAAHKRSRTLKSCFSLSNSPSLLHSPEVRKLERCLWEGVGEDAVLRLKIPEARTQSERQKCILEA
eukprot:28516-Eustigmatos_ZCMA.PRE.1